MPRPFRQLTPEQFVKELNGFSFKRKVTAVHMHHTFIPRKTDYAGKASIESMFRFHTQENGWDDIAQHLSIAPDGTIWTGRDWNKTPASAKGHSEGAFMFETIGNFDKGQERLEGKQRRAVIEVIARVQLKLGLPVESLRFHREFTSAKTCPGNGITRAEILQEVRARRAEIAASGARELETLSGSRTRSGFERPFDDGELEERELGCGAMGRGADTGDFSPALDVAERSGLSPAQLEALRPHVVNLRLGRFSSGGAMETTPADVDAIFRDHLPRALAEAQGRGDPLRIVFYAHGGLVSEARGLGYASDVIPWWKANHVYPIFFVWETGLFDTIRQMLGVGRALEAARGLDDLRDRAVEEVARAGGIPKLWGGMKHSAERSVGSDGGARYVARALAAFCAQNPRAVELHAVGHSAGAIFHSFFVPAALDESAPPFRTVSLLAPAIRVDAFLERLQPVMAPASGVGELTMFTMRRSFELDDRCGPVYGKSLLYLISNALEAKRGDGILGLEDSVKKDARVQRLFGLDGTASDHEIVWSTTDAESGRSATRSTTHGGFDNDRATMESVLRRVLEVGDTDAIVRFPEHATREFDFASPELGGDGEPAREPARAPAVHVHTPMRALCVGIDRYPDGAALKGCVNDARLWSRELQTLGFRTELLLDEAATEAGIRGALEELVDGSRPGDTVVFQFAGHGAFTRDQDGDEDGGNDEMLVPVDFNLGNILLDDEQFEIYQRIPEDAALTVFYDCCHSGTMARAALMSMLGEMRALPDARPRFLDPTPEMREEARRRKAERRARGAARGRIRDSESLNAAIFSACHDDEVAMEVSGQGVFTRHATTLLREAVSGGITNDEFHRRIVNAFGGGAQNPQIDGSRAARRRALLQPLSGAPLRSAGEGPAAMGISDEAWAELLSRLAKIPPQRLHQLLKEISPASNGR